MGRPIGRQHPKWAPQGSPLCLSLVCPAIPMLTCAMMAQFQSTDDFSAPKALVCSKISTYAAAKRWPCSPTPSANYTFCMLHTPTAACKSGQRPNTATCRGFCGFVCCCCCCCSGARRRKAGGCSDTLRLASRSYRSIARPLARSPAPDIDLSRRVAGC